MARHPIALTVAFVFVVFAGCAVAQAQTPSAEGYALGAACKNCHTTEWASWEKTKHANAIRRVSSEKDNPAGCIGCHVTPAGAALREQDVNANVQCEACHGPGQAHIEAANGGAAKPGRIVRKPAEEVCTQCHSAKSPHFKFFAYSALLPLSHAMR